MTVLLNTRHLCTIWWTYLREYRALHRYDPGSDDPSQSTRFVDALIGLGPTFVKLGQILSTRLDIPPDGNITARAQLHEQAPPVASASLAQVHRATLPDGTAVAVKVQLPDMYSLIARDLDAFELVITVLGKIAPRKLRRSNLPAFFKDQDAADLCVQTWCALDYPLAQKWGGHLERSGTIAMGKDHCDFRRVIGPTVPKNQTRIEKNT